MTDETNTPPSSIETTRRVTEPRRWKQIPMLAAVLAAFAVGAGATAIAQKGRTTTYVALTPAPIASMKDGAPVAVQGSIAEVFGNKFVVQDGSGRALVETGREGEGRDLIAKDESVTIQGRFDHGFIHAIAIRHADGRTDALTPRPPAPPHPGRGPAEDPSRP